MIYQGDFRDGLPKAGQYKMLFADPPDNIGLEYDGFEDRLTESEYYDLMFDVFWYGARHSEVLWVSYNAKHIPLVGYLLYEELDNAPDWYVRHFAQYVTFGYYAQKDFGYCLRPMVRIMRKDAEVYPDAVRVESERQRMGDKRADPRGKIPGDVWQIPRVTGNSKQRRSWHNTQLHEDLYKRALLYSTKPGDRVGDLFAGTGTMIRAAKGMGLEVDLFEISPVYCQKLAKEHGLTIKS